MKDIFTNLPTIETERLLLRKVTQADNKGLFYYASNPLVTKNVLWNTHQTIKDSDLFIQYILDQYNQGNVAPWGIEHKANNLFIGTVDYVKWDQVNKVGEIGYVLSHDYWGEGLMPEAVRKVIQFGFEHMKLERIEAKCLIGNLNSSRVMEKCGLEYEGTLRKAIRLNDIQHDIKLYSILKDDHK